MVVPHASYLMDCASPDDELLGKSRGLLLAELQRGEMLGLVMFNSHPGEVYARLVGAMVSTSTSSLAGNLL